MGYEPRPPYAALYSWPARRLPTLPELHSLCWHNSVIGLKKEKRLPSHVPRKGAAYGGKRCARVSCDAACLLTCGMFFAIAGAVRPLVNEGSCSPRSCPPCVAARAVALVVALGLMLAHWPFVACQTDLSVLLHLD